MSGNDIDLSAYTPPSVKIDASISGGIADVLSVTLQINGLKNSSGADISSGVDFTKSKIYLGKNSDPVGDLQDVSGAYSNGVYTLTNAIATANGYSDLSALLADLYLVPEVIK